MPAAGGAQDKILLDGPKLELADWIHEWEKKLLISIILAIGLYKLVKACVLVACSNRAEGEIVAFNVANGIDVIDKSHPLASWRLHPSSVNPTLLPVFTFTDSVGVAHRQPSAVGFDLNIGSFYGYAFQLGEHVRVLYDPANPARAEIDSFQTLWFYPACFMAIGGVLLAKDIYLWRRRPNGLKTT